MAQLYKPVCPTVLIRIRQDAAKPTESTAAADTDPVAAATTINATSKSICDQLAYPFRRCLLVQAVYTTRSLSIAFLKLEREHMLPSALRLEEAFSALFDCCIELHDERLAQGIPDPDAACVVIIDEVQDLIKDVRLEQAGGRSVFKGLGTKAVTSCVDDRAVRVAFSGSSAYVARQFDFGGLFTGDRVDVFELGDPDRGAVKARLEARGYSASEAHAILALCGPRLRLLAGPLQREERPSLERWQAQKLKSGISAFESALESVPSGARQALVDLIQRVADAGRVPWSQVPEELRDKDLTKIFYVDSGRDVLFQSQLHRAVWEQKRGRFEKQLQ